MALKPYAQRDSGPDEDVHFGIVDDLGNASFKSAQDSDHFRDWPMIETLTEVTGTWRMHARDLEPACWTFHGPMIID